MKKILFTSVIALLALSGATLAAETNSMTKDMKKGDHMMQSDSMTGHKDGAMKGAMKGSHDAMKGDHVKAMSGTHKMESKTQ